MAITTLSMVLTVLVLNLYGIADRPVPKSLKRLVFCQLAKLLRMDDSCELTSHEKHGCLETFCGCGCTINSMCKGSKSGKKIPNATTAMAAAAGVAAAANVILPKGGSSVENDSNNNVKDINGHNKTTVLTDAIANNEVKDSSKVKKRFSFKKRHLNLEVTESTPTTPTKTPPPPTRKTPLAATSRTNKTITAQPFTALFQLQLLRQLTPAFQPQSEQEMLPEMVAATESAINFSREWTRLAEIFDRLFFWLFLLAIILSTLGLFHPLIFESGVQIVEED